MQQTSTTYLSGISTDEGQANIRGQDTNRHQQAPDCLEPIVEGIRHQIPVIEKGRGRGGAQLLGWRQRNALYVLYQPPSRY